MAIETQPSWTELGPGPNINSYMDRIFDLLEYGETARDDSPLYHAYRSLSSKGFSILVTPFVTAYERGQMYLGNGSVTVGAESGEKQGEVRIVISKLWESKKFKLISRAAVGTIDAFELDEIFGEDAVNVMVYALEAVGRKVDYSALGLQSERVQEIIDEEVELAIESIREERWEGL